MSLVVLHGGDVYGEFVTRAARELDFSADQVLAVWPNIAGALRERLLDVGVPVFEDPEDTCRWLHLAAGAGDPSGITASGSPSPALVDGTSSVSGGPGSLSSSRPLSYRLASQLLRRSSLNVPRQWYVDGSEEIERVIETVQPYPVVVKAADLSGHKAIHGGVVSGVLSAGGTSSRARANDRIFRPLVVEEQVHRAVSRSWSPLTMVHSAGSR